MCAQRLTAHRLRAMSPRAAETADPPAMMADAASEEVGDCPLEGIPWPGSAEGAEPPSSALTGINGDGGNTLPAREELEEMDGLSPYVYDSGHADTIVPAVASADTPEDGVQPLTDGPSSSPPPPGSPDHAKVRRVTKARPAHVTILPLLGPTVNSRSLVLAATTDASLDLTGDVGPIGRFGALPPPGGRGIQVDLKGTLYNSVRSRTNTALVVDMGADAARVVAAFHEVLLLIPKEEGHAAVNHLSGEEEEDGLADHQMFYSAGRAGGGAGANVGSGSPGSDGEEGQREGGTGDGGKGTARPKRGGKARKRGRGGGAGASATPRKRAKRNGGGTA